MSLNIRFRHKRNEAKNICPRLDNVKTRLTSNNMPSKIIVTFHLYKIKYWRDMSNLKL